MTPNARTDWVTPRELAIVRTVIYASLFDFPLTLDELRYSLIESDQTASEILAVYDGSELLQTIVDYRDGFFFPAGRADLLVERRRREVRSRAFLDRHATLMRLLCALPFTRLVALSGSVAHLNLEEGGDLDVFIITRGPRVWTVTVAVILLTKLLRQRSVVCANFVMADSHLDLDQQDLFTANQVIHLKPIANDDVMADFLAANPFIRRLYPNAALAKPPRWIDIRGRRFVWVKRVIEAVLQLPAPLVEAACRRLYAWHLGRRSATWRSPEQVQLRSDYLKLHTRSHRHRVLDRFDAAVDEAIGQATRALVRPAAVAGRR